MYRRDESDKLGKILVLLLISDIIMMYALLPIFPQIVYIGLGIFGLIGFAAFYFTLFDNRVGATKGFILTCITIVAIILAAYYVRKVPMIEESLSNSNLFVRNRFGVVIANVVIILVLAIFKIKKD